MTKTLQGGITRNGEGTDGTEWNILGQRYFPKATCASTFAFETNSAPGQFVPVHVHPHQDEFILVQEGQLELKLDGVTSKAWTTQDGKTRDGKPIDKGLIYKLLNNRTYLGELRHKEQWYQAEHPPIIDRELWDKVHAILATNGRVRGNATRATVPYLLKGIVFGNDGRALSPFHTTKKNGRRYRYYVPQRENKEHAGASGLPRLPAAELESAVLDQLRAVLRSPDLLGDVLPRAIELDPSLDEAKVTVAMTRLPSG